MNNKELEYCNICGTKLVTFVDGHCCGLKCPKCNEIIAVTTYDDLSSEDKKIYSLILTHNIYTAKKAYILAKTINCDVNIATKLLRQENVKAFEGIATQLKKIKLVFDENEINYEIPEFPYK